MAVDKSKYLVLDLETNGLEVKDDILSISIYKPDDEKIFNKFLPLECAKRLKTTHINGITKEHLKGAKALTQKEVDEIIENFEVKSRIVLIYSSFDEKMLKHYFKRKGLYGFQYFNFYNFKKDVISSRFSEGNISKDNLCKVYGISNVAKVHSSVNDCILEWKLFEKMDGNKLLITENKVFEMNNEYIIPVSLFYSHPNLKYYVSNFPYIEMNYHLIKRFEFSGHGIKRFETNTNGILIEHLINSMLHVKKQDSRKFCIENKSKLKYLGTLPSEIIDMPIYLKEDGTVEAINAEDKKTIKVYNKVLDVLKRQFSPMIEFIREDIFNGKQILSQEKVVHEQENILALCDLSTEDAIMEIKTTYRPSLLMYKEQLYFEAKGRRCFLLQINWLNMPEKFAVEIYGVELSLGEPPETKHSLSYRTKLLENKMQNHNIEIVNYIDTNSKVALKCKVCEHEWETTYYSATHNIKCPFCESKKEKEVRKKVSEEERKQLRASNFVYKVLQKSNGSIIAKNYVGSRENVDVECVKCGYTWTPRADHLCERLYCPRCKFNKGR